MIYKTGVGMNEQELREISNEILIGLLKDCHAVFVDWARSNEPQSGFIFKRSKQVEEELLRRLDFYKEEAE